MRPTTTHHFEMVVLPDQTMVVALVDDTSGEIVATAYSAECAA